jgi:hypothetical protein
VPPTTLRTYGEAAVSHRDDRLRAAALERDPWKRRKLLDEVATGLLKAADHRRRRKPVPKKSPDPDPPTVNGKWRPLADLRALLERGDKS